MANYFPGVSKLANVLDNRMNENSGNLSNMILDFADVLDNYSLKMNNFAIPVPKGDYIILNTLNVGNTDCEYAVTTTDSHSHSGGSHMGHEFGTGTHEHSGGSHNHKVKLPDKFAKLMPGDRVLVGLVQNTYVVIGKIESSSNL